MMENNSNCTKEEKDALIKKEINKLKKNYKDIDKSRRDIAMSIINRAAFMSVTLMDLEETFNREGAALG